MLLEVATSQIWSNLHLRNKSEIFCNTCLAILYNLMNKVIFHHNDVIVYSTAYSRGRSKNTLKLRVSGLCDRRPANFPYKGPVTRKMSPFDDVIMWYIAIKPHLLKHINHYVIHSINHNLYAFVGRFSPSIVKVIALKIMCRHCNNWLQWKSFYHPVYHYVTAHTYYTVRWL